MSNYFKRDRRQVATIHSRQSLKADWADSSVDDDDSNPLPSRVQFLLPSGEIVADAPTNREISIGRHSRPEDPEVTVDLQSYKGHALGVSRFHALIRTSNGRLVLRDLDSVNGTMINGQVAVPLQKYALVDGDEITFGELTLTLKFIN